MSTTDLCGKYNKSHTLRSFFDYIFSLSFEEKPDYKRLRILLNRFKNEKYEDKVIQEEYSSCISSSHSSTSK